METSRALGPVDRRGWSVIAFLLGVAGLAWLVTADRMTGMEMGPGTDPGSFGFYLGVWVVMMAAMMFPSVAPTVAIYDSLRRPGDDPGARIGGTGAFVAGYLVSWTLFGLIAYALFESVGALGIGVLDWERGGRFAVAAVLALAAAYELTPLKHVCLASCRNPVGFLLGGWRDGVSGALRLGAENGAWCIGCCWALMAVLFALGLMSIGWMLLVAAMVAAEKLLPWRRVVAAAVVAILLALSAGLALAPEDVPGLITPGSADHGMGEASESMSE